MPIIKSAIKRVKQDAKRRERNRVVKDELKSRIKALNKVVTNGDSKKVEKALNDVYSQIDKAVKKNLLHKHTAARKKSQLAKTIASLAPPKKTKSTAAKKTSAKTTKSKSTATKKS